MSGEYVFERIDETPHALGASSVTLGDMRKQRRFDTQRGSWVPYASSLQLYDMSLIMSALCSYIADAEDLAQAKTKYGTRPLFGLLLAMQIGNSRIMRSVARSLRIPERVLSVYGPN